MTTPKRRERRVAIIGGGPSNRLAPFGDQTWNIWGLAWRIPPRADALFDIHHPEFKPRDHYNSPYNERYRENVRKSCVPLYCHRESMALFGKGAREFPNERVLELTDGYAECSVSYLLGFAILKGASEIGLWGVDLHATGPYCHQRPNIEFLLGIARGRGIKTWICPGSYLRTSMWEDGRYGVTYTPRSTVAA